MLRLLCLVLSVCGTVRLEEVDTAWARFRQRKYSSPIVTEGVGRGGEPIVIVQDNEILLSRKDEKTRFTNFKKTFELVNELNAKKDVEFTADFNDFADYSDTEWDTELLGLNMSRKSSKSRMFAPVEAMSGHDGSDIPTSIDWVEKGKVTGIKFQGVCGSCWAFAATAVLESHYAIYGGNLKFMSEQQLLDCVYPAEDGCQGGWYSDGWVTIRKQLNNQLPTEDSYTYLAATMQCKQDRGNNALIAANVDYPQIVAVDYQSNQQGPYYDEKLANAVAIGPVAVAMRVINSFKVYKSGLYTEKNCVSGNPNHAVVVVGYTPKKFRVRNSWGTSWGEEGYVWFDRRVQNQCWIAMYAEYPQLRVTGTSENEITDDPCAKIVCLNDGMCVPKGKGGQAGCICYSGFTGQFCQEKICEDVLKRCPKSSSPKCKRRKYATKCPVTCGTCYN